ncbi:hypothetical protein PGT21_018720 [Puccinia graminis f. sp. tritici]|uniref:Uncharacterized protein n=1 Tax=Puccinia graminis f. sp. tritici TaxID=56615 RepID=A0A5B0LMZ4_PUCGR|nr:hypothetical protein PGT21_018720 [Puccinia graminis f. sp. tritici]
MLVLKRSLEQYSEWSNSKPSIQSAFIVILERNINMYMAIDFWKICTVAKQPELDKELMDAVLERLNTIDLL